MNCDMAYSFLYEAFGGGSLDWGTLFDKMEKWNIDESDVIERGKELSPDGDINSFFYAVFQQHEDDVKAWLKDMASDVDVYVDEGKIDDYELDYYIDHMASTYDDSYEFWDADDQDDMLKYVDDIAEFLVENNIVDTDEVTEKVCKDRRDNCEECDESKDEYIEKCKDDVSVEDMIDYITTKLKGK